MQVSQNVLMGRRPSSPSLSCPPGWHMDERWFAAVGCMLPKSLDQGTGTPESLRGPDRQYFLGSIARPYQDLILSSACKVGL
jgi:hypothetical protein